jgi:hypothetical protein
VLAVGGEGGGEGESSRGLEADGIVILLELFWKKLSFCVVRIEIEGGVVYHGALDADSIFSLEQGG